MVPGAAYNSVRKCMISNNIRIVKIVVYQQMYQHINLESWSIKVTKVTTLFLWENPSINR